MRERDQRIEALEWVLYAWVISAFIGDRHQRFGEPLHAIYFLSFSFLGHHHFRLSSFLPLCTPLPSSRCLFLANASAALPLANAGGTLMFWEQFSAFSSVMFLCAFVLRVVGWAAGHDATSHVGWATLGLSVILSCLKFLDVMSMSRVYVSCHCECLFTGRTMRDWAYWGCVLAFTGPISTRYRQHTYPGLGGLFCAAHHSAHGFRVCLCVRISVLA